MSASSIPRTSSGAEPSEGQRHADMVTAQTVITTTWGRAEPALVSRGSRRRYAPDSQ